MGGEGIRVGERDKGRGKRDAPPTLRRQTLSLSQISAMEWPDWKRVTIWSAFRSAAAVLRYAKVMS